MSFPLAAGFMLRWEQGRADDSADPGGRTYCGMTQSSFAQWLKVPLEGCQDVWTASPEQVISFYRNWWTQMGAEGYDRVDERLGILMFDACVQHGNKLAVQFLQRAIHITDDGKFGPNTFQRLHLAYHDDTQGVLLRVVQERKDHYMERGLKPQLTKFLNGWIARADDCKAVAQCQVAGLVNVVKKAHHNAKLPITTSEIP